MSENPLLEQIRLQGDLVRSLKAAKAPANEVSIENIAEDLDLVFFKDESFITEMINFKKTSNRKSVLY